MADLKKIDPASLDAVIGNYVKAQLAEPVIKHPYQRQNCISYWYPQLLADRSIPMPKTYIFFPDVDLYEFANALDPGCPPATRSKFDLLVHDVNLARLTFGGQAFLRTGTFSGKHEWKATCHLKPDTMITHNLMVLIEEAALRDQALDVFAVREFLPTAPVFHAFNGDMPITKERRFFARDGQILGHIPYWPEEAFERQKTSIPDWRPAVEELARLTPEDEGLLTELAKRASRLLPGTWSIDFLKTRDQKWYLTDCALGRMSYGWNKEWGDG